VLAGVGTLALGVFGVLAVTGESRFDDCASTHTCSSSEKNALSVERDVAWATLAASIVAYGAAAWIYFNRPRTAPALVGLRMGPAASELVVRW
jgi:hypothetical protein